MKDPLRWRDGRRFNNRVEVHSANADDHGATYRFRVHGDLARCLCLAQITEPSCSDSRIWKVVLIRIPPTHTRVGDPQQLLPYSYGTRYVGREIFKPLSDNRLLFRTFVYKFQNVHRADQWAYVMAQLDALGYHWPYPHLDSV